MCCTRNLRSCSWRTCTSGLRTSKSGCCPVTWHAGNDDSHVHSHTFVGRTQNHRSSVPTLRPRPRKHDMPSMHLLPRCFNADSTHCSNSPQTGLVRRRMSQERVGRGCTEDWSHWASIHPRDRQQPDRRKHYNTLCVARLFYTEQLMDLRGPMSALTISYANSQPRRPRRFHLSWHWGVQVLREVTRKRPLQDGPQVASKCNRAWPHVRSRSLVTSDCVGCGWGVEAGVVVFVTLASRRPLASGTAPIAAAARRKQSKDRKVPHGCDTSEKTRGSKQNTNCARQLAA